MRILAPLLITLLLLAACSGGSKGPLAPAQAPLSEGELPAPLQREDTPAATGTGLLGMYDVVLDFARGSVTLTPLGEQRESSAFGDLYLPDISPYLTSAPCSDCFQVKAFSLDPLGNLQVDFGMRHPFPSTEKRRDLDVFDARAIVIAAGTTTFPGSPKVRQAGGSERTVQGHFDLLLNADGYSGHFDTKVEDPQYFNPPLDLAGSVNPYIAFFTESDPSPTRTGFPVANHRFSQSPVMDVKRFVFKLPPGDTNQLRVIVVLKAGYGVSATWAQTRDFPGTPGSRMNPVYFLPAFNQPEAYRVQVELDGHFTAGAPADVTRTATIRIEDWQAGLVGDPAYGDLARPTLIPATSDVARVTGELPGLMSGVQELDRVSGAGRFGDPYLYQWTLRNELGAGPGDYIGLVSVVDDLNGTATRPTATPGEELHSFITWQAVRVRVEEGTGVNNPPVAVATAEPNPVDSGAQVLLVDRDSYDPDVADQIILYEWDFDISDGRTYTDSVAAVPDQAVTSYLNTGTEPRTVTASLRVTDTFGASDVQDLDVLVLPPVAGNNPPVAVPVAVPDPTPSGEPVHLQDDQSWDPDPGDTIVLFEWDFDISNGRAYTDSVSTSPNQAFATYTNPGEEPIIKTASLRVTDPHGASHFADIAITIEPVPTGGNRPPVAVAEAIKTTVASDELVEFIDSNSYDPDPLPDKIVEYAWDYDLSNGADYTDSVSSLPNRGSKRYTNTSNDPVEITVGLRVKDTFGAVGFDEIIITVLPAPVLDCPDPLQAPSGFRMDTWPTPPYWENPITLTWTAPNDPDGCLLGYAVWRSTRVGPDNAWKLLSDLNGNNQLEVNEIITGTTFTDQTWTGPGNPTTNKYYMYVVRTVSRAPGNTIKQSVDSNRVFVYVNDFEGMNQLTGGTWRGTRSGFSWGRINAWAYPDITAFNYGFEIATNLGNTGSHCLDESADIAAGGYGPTNHAPYARGSEFDPWIDDGYWNSFGPQLFTDLDNNPFSGVNFRQMQLYHKYQMETYFDPNQGVEVAADMGYVCVTPHADWENNRFNKLIDVPIVDGKGYDSAVPGVNPFLDQQYWPPSEWRPDQQVPKMHFLAGDYRTPGAGAPDWTRSVFDLTAARNMNQPVLQFAFAGDEWPQHPSHSGWSIDDILVVAY